LKSQRSCGFHDRISKELWVSECGRSFLFENGNHYTSELKAMCKGPSECTPKHGHYQSNVQSPYTGHTQNWTKFCPTIALKNIGKRATGCYKKHFKTTYVMSTATHSCYNNFQLRTTNQQLLRDSQTDPLIVKHATMKSST
jgi:hypothetical protein